MTRVYDPYSMTQAMPFAMPAPRLRNRVQETSPRLRNSVEMSSGDSNESQGKHLSSKPSSSKLFQAQMNSLISLKWTRLISKTSFLPKRYQDHIRCPGLFSRILKRIHNAFLFYQFVRVNGNQLKACNILMRSRLWDLLGWAAWALDKVFL